MKTDSHAVVLFDGVCNLCNGSVNFLMDRDKSDAFRFGSLQSEKGAALLEQYGIKTDETDSVILIENGAAHIYSTAALRIARRLGGAWSVFYGLILIPAFIRDPFYKLIAKNRYRLFGKRDMCRMPGPDDAKKFI